MAAPLEATNSGLSLGHWRDGTLDDFLATHSQALGSSQLLHGIQPFDQVFTPGGGSGGGPIIQGSGSGSGSGGSGSGASTVAALSATQWGALQQALASSLAIDAGGTNWITAPWHGIVTNFTAALVATGQFTSDEIAAITSQLQTHGMVNGLSPGAVGSKILAQLSAFSPANAPPPSSTGSGGGSDPLSTVLGAALGSGTGSGDSSAPTIGTTDSSGGGGLPIIPILLGVASIGLGYYWYKNRHKPEGAGSAEHG